MEMKLAGGSGRRRRSRATSSCSSASSGGGGVGTTAATAVERKEAERKRRQHMKDLSFKLVSLLPKHHSSASKANMTQLGSMDEAAAYIKKLKERVDELHHKKLTAAASIRVVSQGASVDSPSTSSAGAGAVGSEGVGEVPVVEVRYHEDGLSSYLDVVLICSAESPFKFHEMITVLEEEGAEILNANFSIAGNKFFYTIHSRVFSSRIGIEVSRVSERLRALI